MGLRYLGNIIKPGYNPLASNITTGVNVVQYQGVFTAQQQLQAQANQQWVKDPYDYANTLLLQADGIANGSQNNTFLDSSTNNFTITRNGNTTQGSFTPFSNQPGAWGNYFNNSAGSASSNTGNYLTTNTAAISSVGSSDFSIECFVYALQLTQTTVQGLVSYGVAGSTTGTSYLSLEISSTGYLGCAYATAASTTVADPSTFPINQWVHVVVCRSGSTLSLYVNGIRKATATTSATVGNSGNGLVIGGQWYDASVSARDLNGYMSNVRIVKGSSAYDATQTTLTVPTAPLTAITNTSLLTCQSNRFIDNSSNGYAITVFSNVQTSIQPFSPFAPQYQWTSDVIGGSGYFDGTGDYLSCSASASPTTTQNFTIEGWVYVPSAATEYAIINNTNSTSGFYLRVSSTGKIQVVQTNVADIVASTNSVKPNAWNYFCVTRSGNTFNIYLNSTSVDGTTSNSVSFTTGGNTYVGAYYNGLINLNGYLASLRIVIGTATAPSSVPTAPLTAISGTSLLLNFTNAGIYDATMKNNLETVGNAQISTSVVKYGSGSIKFNGSTDYLLIRPDAPLPLYVRTADFTVEAWIYLSSTSAANYMLWGNNGPDIQFWVDTSAKLNCTIGAVGGPTGSITIPTNTWVHVAATRTAGYINLFVNGVFDTRSTTGGTSNLNNSKYYVGTNTVSYFNGYIDDMRFTLGVARYISSFIPPSVALPRQ